MDEPEPDVFEPEPMLESEEREPVDPEVELLPVRLVELEPEVPELELPAPAPELLCAYADPARSREADANSVM